MYCSDLTLKDICTCTIVIIYFASTHIITHILLVPSNQRIYSVNIAEARCTSAPAVVHMIYYICIYMCSRMLALWALVVSLKLPISMAWFECNCALEAIFDEPVGFWFVSNRRSGPCKERVPSNVYSLFASGWLKMPIRDFYLSTGAYIYWSVGALHIMVQSECTQLSSPWNVWTYLCSNLT